MMKIPVNWDRDPKTWLAHSAWAVLIVVMYHLVLQDALGGALFASVLFYLKEFWTNPGWSPLDWPTWDAVLDFVCPSLTAIVTYLMLM